MTCPTNLKPPSRSRPSLKPDVVSLLTVGKQPIHQAVVAAMPCKYDYTGTVAHAVGIEAVSEKLRDHRFDLVLFDGDMPRATVLEGIRTVRANPANRHARIVILTPDVEDDKAILTDESTGIIYAARNDLSPELLKKLASGAPCCSATVHPADIRRETTPKNRQCGCAGDIKPLVSHLMREMRVLRTVGQMPEVDAREQVRTIEGSLRRLWAFLDILDNDEPDRGNQKPTVPATRGARERLLARINARVPSKQPTAQAVKPPSIYRRRS